MSKKSTTEDLQKSISDTINTINEVLAKSGMPLKKDEPEKIEDQAAAAEGADGATGATTPAEDAGEPHDESAEPPEAGEGQPGEESMEAMASALSDEELHMLMDVLHSEAMKRGGEGQGEATEAPAPAPAEGAGNLAMSMKPELAALAKSQESMAKTVEALAKSVEALAAQAKRPAAPAAKPVAKPAVANRHSVEVLEKSTTAQPTTKLSKSETLAFLEGEIRNGNRKVNSAMVTDAIYCNDEKSLAEMHDRIRKSGIALPV